MRLHCLKQSTSSMRSIPSKIKSIFLELPGYTFNHSAREGNQKYYVGRSQNYQRLKTILGNSADCESGTYLVAGYRGMGKTSLVNQVILDINKVGLDFSKEDPPKNPNYRDVELSPSEKIEKAKDTDLPGPVLWPIRISLSQDDVKDIDVLKLMANQLAQEWFHFMDKLIPKDLANENNGLPSKVLARLQTLSDNLNAIVKVQTGFNNRIIQDSKLATGLRNRKPSFDKRITEQDNQLGHREIIRNEFLPKEVERELIYILSLIAELRKRLKDENKGNIPQFIFVLDELDKIEPNYFYESDYQSKPTYTQQEEDNIFGVNKVRKRQEVISRLLANLKSFLNTAKAKFIFIGGREMYDASLADIADRDSFYGSIFHDIIYIESFFKDRMPEVRGGITQLVEAYLCNLLIPWEDKQKSGAEQNDIFWQELPQSKDLTLASIHLYLEAINQEPASIPKLIFFLQNFIIFLAYRSNGTPKKMVSILESYIVEEDAQNLSKKDGDYLLVQRENASKLWLYFSYHDQYEIGLTANIYRPYVIVNSRHLKVLEDKLLYSSAYIMDYLLKFHANAFSWRNLELIPEIILTNKDPNLRYYITDILIFLSNTYIRETVTGLFQFRYYNRASHEIKFLTKISEKSAAAFSFTLDESQHIIQYYRRKLHQLRSTFPNYQQEFIYPIAFTEGLLADLYYFEKEYDEAIVNYSSSIQLLRKMAHEAPGSMSYQQIILYIKNSLHIGLCLEKIKAFDTSYAIYRSLMLNAPILFEAVAKDNEKDMVWDKPARRLHLLIKPYVAFLDLFEKQRINGFNYANLARNYEEFSSFLLGNKANVAPSIGQERIEGSPAEHKDVMRIALLFSDYYHSVGGLLYYKNRNFAELQEILHQIGALGGVNRNLHQFIQQIYGKVQIGHFRPSFSAFTYYYLAIKKLTDSYDPDLNSIRELGAEFTQHFASNDHALLKVFYLLQPECNGTISNNVLVLLGNMLTRMGDTLLASLSLDGLQQFPIDQRIMSLFGNENLNEYDVENYENILKEIHELIPENSTQCLLTKLLNINNVLLIYRMAGLIYLKAGKMYSYSFQYRKFLFVFKDYVQYVKMKNPTLGLGHGFIENVAERIFNANTWITDLANRPQVLKYRKVFSTSGEIKPEVAQWIYSNLSNNPEIKETIVLTEEIKLKIGISRLKNIVTPFDLISNFYARVYELKLQAELNYAKLKNTGILEALKSTVLIDLCFLLGPERVKNNYSGHETISKEKLAVLKTQAHERYKSHPKWKEIFESKNMKLPPFAAKDKLQPHLNADVERCIKDSIFALFEIIRTLNIYGPSYICNHSFLANIHAKLSDWCIIAKNFDLLKGAEETLEKELIRLMGKDNMDYLDPDYHKELAIQHYNAALQMHSEGGAYKRANLNMSFLEDDFNDNLYHFMAALERLHINSGVIAERLNGLKKAMRTSDLYHYGSYLREEDGDSLFEA